MFVDDSTAIMPGTVVGDWAVIERHMTFVCNAGAVTCGVVVSHRAESQRCDSAGRVVDAAAVICALLPVTVLRFNVTFPPPSKFRMPPPKPLRLSPMTAVAVLL